MKVWLLSCNFIKDALQLYHTKFIGIKGINIFSTSS